MLPWDRRRTVCVWDIDCMENMEVSDVGKKKVFLVFKVLVAVVLIWTLFTVGVVDFSALQSVVSNPATVLLVVSLCFVMYLISILRWQVLLSCQSIEISNYQVANSVFLSLFLNSFLPGGGISGDAVRMAYITSVAPRRKTEGIFSVFIDRGLGLYAIISVGALAGIVLLLQGVNKPVFISLVVMAIAGMIGIPIVIGLLHFFVQRYGTIRTYLTKEPRGQIRDIVLRIVNSIGLYIHTPGKLFQAFLLSLMIQMLVLVAMMVLGSAMNLDEMGAAGYAFATLWGAVSNLLPITPGGLGVGEMAFDRVSHLLMSNGSIAGFGTIFLAYRVLAMIATLPGLLICFFAQGTLKVFSQTSEEI